MDSALYLQYRQETSLCRLEFGIALFLFGWFLESFIFPTNLTLRNRLKDNTHLSRS